MRSIKLDDDDERRLELAVALAGGNRKLIPFAVITVLGGFKGMEPVTNPALKNHLSHVLTRKLRRAVTYTQERFRKMGVKDSGNPLPIMILPDEETETEENS
jgi:hypothetical protein